MNQGERCCIGRTPFLRSPEVRRGAVGAIGAEILSLFRRGERRGGKSGTKREKERERGERREERGRVEQRGRGRREERGEGKRGRNQE